MHIRGTKYSIIQEIQIGQRITTFIVRSKIKLYLKPINLKNVPEMSERWLTVSRTDGSL